MFWIIIGAVAGALLTIFYPIKKKDSEIYTLHKTVIEERQIDTSIMQDDRTYNYKKPTSLAVKDYNEALKELDNEFPGSS